MMGSEMAYKREDGAMLYTFMMFKNLGIVNKITVLVRKKGPTSSFKRVSVVTNI